MFAFAVRCAVSLFITASAVLLSSCAIVNATGGDGDDGPGDGGDGPGEGANCGASFDLGLLTNETVGPFDSCSSSTLIDFERACGVGDQPGAFGFVFEVEVDEGVQNICVLSEVSSIFSVELFCLENGGVDCVRAEPDVSTCRQIRFDQETTAFVHWEPLANVCAPVEIKVEEVDEVGARKAP